MDLNPTPAAADPVRSSRERLLESAAGLFSTQGYAHVSLDQVLRDSGVVRSNFYYHFRGKEDLALSVIDLWLEHLQQSVLVPIEQAAGLSPLERAHRLLHALIEDLEAQGCRGGCPFGTMASSESEHNERFRTKLIGIFEGFLAHLTGLFAAAREAGQLRADAPAPEALAAVTLSIVQGGYLLSKTFRDASTMRTAVDVWMHAVSANSDSVM
jgi:TetR/AcrR family transcriptional repressor of nem operon